MTQAKTYELLHCDETSPLHTGRGKNYAVIFRGARIGHLSIHAGGFREWTFIAGARRPSASTQRRLAQSAC